MDILPQCFEGEPDPDERTLEEIIYDDIIGNLMICPDHRPEGVLSFPHSSILSLANPELISSEQMICLVRERLNHKLSDLEETDPNIRQKLVKMFRIKTAKKKSLDHVDLWAFFDGVLNETFEELETYVAFRGAETNPLLASTIAKRSPNLEKLKLNFKFNSRGFLFSSGTFPNLSKRTRHTFGSIQSNNGRMMPLIQSLDSLHHLTSLTLYHLDDYLDANSAVLPLIGKHCPSLTHLRLAKCRPTSKHDSIAIILGELMIHLIGPKQRLYQQEPYWGFKQVAWAENAALGRLRVPSEFLTPVCFSLRHLEIIECIDYINAFILRHIPNLEKLESCSGTAKAVHLLHKESEEVEESPGSIQLDFEKTCRDAIDLHGLALRNPREPVERPQSTFSGILSLTKLEYVNIQDENIIEILRAIELTCPHLKNFTFGEKKKVDGSRHHWPTPSENKYHDAPGPSSELAIMDSAHQELELALRKWPKLESITFVKIVPEFIKVILNVFHEELKELSFIGCNPINLEDLSCCNQLKSLHISSSCSLGSSQNAPTLNSDTFLPNLESFSCKICMGLASSVFEEKSNFKKLILKCCHKNIQESIEHQKWKSLEILHLQHCSGLTDIAMVSQLIDEFVVLKELFLPSSLLVKDHNHLAPEIKRKALARPIPINLKFKKFFQVVHCLFDPMSSNVAGNFFGLARQMLWEVVDSPPSRRSDDERTLLSDNSTTDHDPYESQDELYHDSE